MPVADRLTFGLSSLRFFKVCNKWRLNDLLASIVLIVLYSLFENAHPFEREFYINDMTIRHNYTETERISSKMLFVVAGVVPTALIFVLGLVMTRGSLRDRFYMAWVSFNGFLISVTITCFITGFSKNWIGRPRPDFILRCQLKPDLKEDVYYVASDVCNNPDQSVLNDGMRSCPSGHSSFSFSGLGYLTFWLLGQSMASHKRVGVWRCVFAAVPTFSAMLVAISRTEDYRHRYSDVFLGSLLGFVVSYWSYRRYFPQLTSNLCYLPHTMVVDENFQVVSNDEYDEDYVLQEANKDIV